MISKSTYKSIDKASSLAVCAAAYALTVGYISEPTQKKSPGDKLPQRLARREEASQAPGYLVEPEKISTLNIAQ